MLYSVSSMLCMDVILSFSSKSNKNRNFIKQNKLFRNSIETRNNPIKCVAGLSYVYLMLKMIIMMKVGSFIYVKNNYANFNIFI